MQAEKLMTVRGMVSGISHELNNPLQGILALSQILALDAKEDAFRNDASVISHLAEQCRAIVRDLLIFSEGEESHKEELDFHFLMNHFLDIWEKKVIPENVHVTKNFDGRLALTKANPGQLNQVFFHVLHNAVQAMPEGGEFQILTEVKENAEKPYVEVRFQDTGEGIAQEQLGRVFDPFFTTKEVGQGKGLGLSFCQGILQSHEGSISVESQGVGKGTSVVVRLPIEKTPQ